MTTSTTDAEAIARIIDPDVFCYHKSMIEAGLKDGLSADEARAQADRCTAHTIPPAVVKAERILSYLASRRGAQEPVDWIYEDELPPSYPYGRMFAYSKVRDGVRMFPVYAPQAAPAPAGEVERPTPNNRFSPRMLLLDDLHAVCVGGRWDGWKFWKHPDGQWVSLEKLAEEPRAALNGGRE